MRQILGGALAVVAFGSGIVFAVWAAILELRLVYAVGGFWLAVAGFLVLPFTVPLAALLAGVMYGDWDPLLLVVAVAVSAAVATLGVMILKK